jgi:hypothetical protein
MERRKELATFLQVRRKQLTPGEVGLPSTSRRRTPGLRREEVAQLAAVGQTWYTWLEQGRNIRVSSQVLVGISRALRLTPPEQRHIFDLAQLPVPEGLQTLAECTDPRLKALVDGFDQLPAMLINQKWDVLYWNESMQRLCGCLEGQDRPNALHNLLFQHVPRERLVNWEAQVEAAIALFRSQTAKFMDADWYIAFVADLTERSEIFRTHWLQQSIHNAIDEPKHYRLPTGDIRVATTLLSVQDCPHLQMIVNTPIDDASRMNLTKLNT